MNDTTDEADSGKRQEKRDSLYLSVQIEVAGRPPIATRVRNLSARGMLVDLPLEACAGDAVCGELRGIGTVCGMIAWVADGRAGIAFDEDVDPQLARTPTGAKTSTPAYYAPAYIPVEPARRPGVRARR